MQVSWIIIVLFASFSTPIAQQGVAVGDSLSGDPGERPEDKNDRPKTLSWQDDEDAENEQPLLPADEYEESTETEPPPKNFSHPEDEEDESDTEVTTPVPGLSSTIVTGKKNVTVDNGTCGDPPAVENAEIVSGKNPPYIIGAVVSYGCEFGFASDEYERTSQCLLSEESGIPEWTTPHIRCLAVSCGDPGFVDNGVRTGSLFIFPNSVSYHCDHGFKLVGSGVRYCQTNGRWSGRLPTCRKVTCDPPADIENGKVFYSRLDFRSELRYQCDHGFRLKKHETRYCTGNGTWSGNDPVCLDSHCDPPEIPKNGKVVVVGGKASVDSRALYTCEEGYVLKGSRVSICLENGNWTFPAPKCFEPCAVPEVPHGRIGKYEKRFGKKTFRELPVGSKLRDGEELYLFCESKYEPLGKQSTEEKVICEKGQWSDIPRCEPERCRAYPPYVASSGISKLERHHGGKVAYKCYQNFRKTPGNITCVFGSWQGVKPICTDTRCKIDSISFPGVLKGKKDIYYNGESFNPVCDSNHTATKTDNLLTCKNGNWTGHLPPCTPASCSGEPPTIEHGYFKSYSTLHSSVVTYECEEYFELVESSSKVRCLFGQWEGTRPVCKESRCHTKDLEKTEGVIMSEAVTSSGEFLRVECADGFSTTGSEPFCSRGVWSQPSPPCRESDCTVYQIQNGHITKKVETRKWDFWKACYVYDVNYEKVRIGESKSPGSSLYTSCRTPFTFQGKDSNDVPITCKKGKWRPRPICLSNGISYKEETTTVKPPSSLPTSPPPVTVQSLKPRQASLAPTENNPTRDACSCTYLNMDEELLGYSGSEPVLPGTKVKDGCKVTFFCKQFGYYRLQGPAELLCKNCADWHSTEYPSCVAPVTGDTIFDFHGRGRLLPWGAFGIEQGETLEITCIANGVAGYPVWRGPPAQNVYHRWDVERLQYSHSYKSILNIMEADENNNGMYECAVKGYRANVVQINVIGSTVACQEFPASEELSVQYSNGQWINSRANFSCKDDKKNIVGPSSLTCTSNGNWSGNPPTCKLPVTCPKLEESEGLSITYSLQFEQGSQAMFQCLPPRVHVGSDSSKCKYNGKWSNPVPSCLLPNCSVDELFEVVPEGVIPVMENISSSILPYNSTLKLTCELENFALLGSEIAKCESEGKWKVSSVQCIPGCAPLKTPDKVLIVEPERNFYRIGDIVSVSCPEGYNLSQDVFRIMCLSPQWSETDEIPHCKLEEKTT